MSKPIPKSLHTVRVVAIMALDAQNQFHADGLVLNDRGAIDHALFSLGYSLDQLDTHGIRAKARKAMRVEAQERLERELARAAA